MTIMKTIVVIGDHVIDCADSQGFKVSVARLGNVLKFLEEIFIRTKRSERAKRAHSVLREVEKMGYKNFSPYPYRVVG